MWWRTKMIKKIMPNGKQRATSTINRNIAYLRAALSKAVDWNLLHENPLRRIKLKPEDASMRDRYLDPDELQRPMVALDTREETLWAQCDGGARGQPSQTISSQWCNCH